MLLVRVICIMFAVSISAYAQNIRPVPWITEGAIAFLETFLETHQDAKILEFGSGASTIWFSKKNVELVSIEHNPGWHERVNNILQINKTDFRVRSILSKRPYYAITKEFPDEFFDLILVDGRDRKKCIEFSISKLKRGGILMLDNAERKRYQEVFKQLSDWKRFDAFQTKPDSCGFVYSGWLTSWWIKPE